MRRTKSKQPRRTAPTIPHTAPAASPRKSTSQTRNPIARFLLILGPGLITGASDDDPSGIGTYAVAGASLGFSTLWTALVTFPMMTAVQFMCAKIGMVTGMGLARVLRKHYPPALLYPVVGALVVARRHSRLG
jgi:Mn2+/Fe2+ NRAMP family transporter